jgi:hypothetical protein
MEITIKIINPFKNIKDWFKYDKRFWELCTIERSVLGLDDIDRNYFHCRYIRHRFTGKSLSYDGWGDKLRQVAIYQVNGQYHKLP